MRKLIYSENYSSDLQRILEDLSSRSVKAARRFALKHTERTNRLVILPGMGRSRDDLLEGLRSLVVDQYLVFYTFTDDEVLLVRLIHGRSDLGELVFV